MAWKIDRDYLYEPGASIPSRVGTSQGTLDGATFTFRIRDDDGEIYYHGIADKAATEDDTEDGGLYMAERWAEYDAGAIDLQLHVRDAIKYGLWTQALADEYNQKPEDWVSIYG